METVDCFGNKLSLNPSWLEKAALLISEDKRGGIKMQIYSERLIVAKVAYKVAH